MEQAVYAFRVEGKPVTCERYGFGHINKTYRIVTSWGNMYELQRINRHVFTNIPNLMENIGNVTRYAAQRVRHPMEALCLVPTVDGKIGTRMQTAIAGGCTTTLRTASASSVPRPPRIFTRAPKPLAVSRR